MCVSSLRRGHAHLLCMVPRLTARRRFHATASKKKSKQPAALSQLNVGAGTTDPQARAKRPGLGMPGGSWPGPAPTRARHGACQGLVSGPGTGAVRIQTTGSGLKLLLRRLFMTTADVGAMHPQRPCVQRTRVRPGKINKYLGQSLH